MTNAQNEQSANKKENLARFFLEQRHIAWVSLAVALLWGIYGLLKMPQRKDPDIPVRQAMVIVPWQGTSSEQVEQLVTRKVEQALASNQWVTEIKSASRTGSAMVQFELAEKGKYDREKELDDVKIRLDAIHDLPQGAGPILYIKDFGDTSALMLTVASPPADPAQVAWISKLVETQVRQVRSGLDAHTQSRRSIVVVFPKSIDSDEVERKLSWVIRDMATQHLCSDVRVFSGAGFTGVDLATNLSTPDLQSALRKFANQDLQTDELHPDAWKPAIIDEPANTTAALQAVAGDKYRLSRPGRLYRYPSAKPQNAVDRGEGRTFRGIGRERISEFLAAAPRAIQAKASRSFQYPRCPESTRRAARRSMHADARSVSTPQASSRVSTICGM